ncbi:dihydrolipoamide acetyltransferase component of pyruvate dehydrogenase complex [Streptomyces spiroverticillatus]|uniref:Dihydrolipoamide acetyltransferase component of pyruvate dehydrogenase complex n=1 Tax=Streptomyces finlayi TaxID=67296 RepID=A0A918WWW0_9ACTN|nr:2-oxo acid dehydrogenase subunit E2 [Streptomyces finlayi]GHA09164.1 dihydrolipoamide acetyltransferase component of pyruvate dehydrogenase complex [Streptomyces spiroverticillatus]GHC91919.1 dihydrolipoamide acetyltransferase component of pyruvate dehydrogenase complex [Streptomyces finlayi]
MTVSVTLPALGESVTEGTVTRWLKQVGERVEADEPLLEVSTDKVDTEIPAPMGGVLLEITAAQDETVEVGAALGVIGTPVEAPTKPTPTPVAPSTPPTEAASPAPVPGQATAPHPSPAAPSSPAPVPTPTPAPAPVPTAAVAAAPPVAAPTAGPDSVSLRGRTVPMTRIRRAIGNNLKKALQEQAQLTTTVEADVTRLMRLRGRAKDGFLAREGLTLSPLPFFIKAAAQALRAHPVVNARIDETAGTITYFDTENIGIAVDTEEGLMTPVVKAAGDLTVAGLARAVHNLAGRARSGHLTPDDVSGATFTISDTGSRGALFDTVIVPPQEVAILGVGATVRRPAVVRDGDDEVIGIRDLVHLSLSYDHRLVDGADAARYLTSVKAILEAAEFEGNLYAETAA